MRAAKSARRTGRAPQWPGGPSSRRIARISGHLRLGRSVLSQLPRVGAPRSARKGHRCAGESSGPAVAVACAPRKRKLLTLECVGAYRSIESGVTLETDAVLFRNFEQLLVSILSLINRVKSVSGVFQESCHQGGSLMYRRAALVSLTPLFPIVPAGSALGVDLQSPSPEYDPYQPAPPPYWL